MDVSRLNYEYQQKTKTYTPYDSANIQIIAYNEIRVKTENKKTKEKSFEPVTSKTKVKPLDDLVLVYDNDKFKFFSSMDNLATGYTDEADFRDTLFFDHPNKIAILARRKIVPYKPEHVTLIPENQLRLLCNVTGKTIASNPITVQPIKEYVDYQLQSVKSELEKIEEKETKKRSRRKAKAPENEGSQVSVN